MKKYLIICSCLLLCSLQSQAQTERSEKLKSYQVGFITERLNLTPDEAQKFWPIYNAYDKKMESLRGKEHKALRNFRQDADSLSDKEVQSILDEMLEAQEERIKHRKNLVNDLKNVLPVKKVLTLIKTEEDFKRKLLKELRNRRRAINNK